MARFNGPRSAYTLTYWGGTTVRVAGPDGVDMVSNVETFAFDDQRVAFSVPTAITSNGGGDTATVSVLENTTAVTTVTAFDRIARRSRSRLSAAPIRHASVLFPSLSVQLESVDSSLLRSNG